MLRNLFFFAGFAILAQTTTYPVGAQSLSAADIKAKVEAKVGGLNEYQVLLNDPDPVRSIAAMEVMLESGDSALVRMALDYGLFSPNPQVRYIALKAFFDSSPTLRMTMDGSKVEDQRYFTTSVSELDGTVGSGLIGFASMKVGKYDPERSCYQHETRNVCFVRLSETEVSISPWNNDWFKATLNDQGQLIGEIGFVPPAPVVIPVSN